MKRKRTKLPPTPSDYEYSEELIPVTLGLGIKWKDKDGHQCESHLGGYHYRDGKRVARISESNYVGTSPGAIHYYASIVVHGPDVLDKKEGTIFSDGGYGPEHPRFHLTRLRISARRKLTKVEKDGVGEVIGPVGSYTYRFNTPEEAKQAAIDTFKKRFAPGWVLLCEDLDDNDGKPLAET